jgi:ABC-type phosphate transport system substrate-binding protein
MTKTYQLTLRALACVAAFVALNSHADVVVVVGSKSPVGTLSRDDVRQIYLGKAKAFPSGGTAITSITGSGPSRDEFLSNVLEKTDSQARATWSRLVFTGTGNAPKELKDSAEIKQLVANNPSIIGVIDKATVDGTVKVVFAP